MTAEISGVSSVLARIAQIQQQFTPSAILAGNSSSSALANSLTSGSSTDFATALAAATGDSTSSTSATDLTSALASLTGSSTSSSAVTGDEVVASAKKYLGVPYVFGGTTTTGLDCSGLVQKAYGDLGITVPRLSWDQAKTGTAVPSLAQAQPGDILGFGTPAHHVAIYLGNNQMIAAPEPGENVKIQSVYETPASIRRIIGSSADTTATAAVTAPATATAKGTTPGISAAVSKYSSLFSQAESKYNLPTGLLAAVAQTESGGNTTAVSPAGAQGLMQFTPTTAAGLGVDPWSAASSIQGAAKLFSGYLSKYNDSVPLALAAYNAGPGSVDQYGGVPPYTETQNYVSKITGLMAGESA